MIKPVGEYVLIEPINRNDSFYDDMKKRAEKSGLLVQETNKPQGAPHIGYLRHIGPEAELDVEIGKKVVFDEKLPEGFRFDGTDFIGVHYKKVIGVVNES